MLSLQSSNFSIVLHENSNTFTIPRLYRRNYISEKIPLKIVINCERSRAQSPNLFQHLQVVLGFTEFHHVHVMGGTLCKE